MTAGADGNGNGWLRLTSTAGYQAGTAIYNTAFPSTDGIVVRFTYATWGGSGADGMSFFLLDGSTANPQPGQPGGALGYSKVGSNSGLTNGYIGIGFDEFGNFSNDSALGTTPGSGGSSSAVANSIVLRGSGNGTTGYTYLIGKRVSQGIATIDRARARPVEIVIQDGRITVKVDYGSGYVTEINQFNLAGASGQAALPATLKLGFSAATGGSTNNHEIRDVDIRKPADLSINSMTADKTTAKRGDTVVFTVVVRNDNVNDANNVNVVLPAAAYAVGSWTCTASAGSTCPANGTGDLTITTLAKNGTATFTVNSTVTAAAGEGTVPATAQLRTVNSDISDTNAANDRASVNVTVAKALEVNASSVISWTEGSPARFIAPNLAVNTVSPIGGARVAINAGYQPGADVLSIGSSTATSGTVDGLTWTWDAARGELVLSGAGDDAKYQAVLRQVTFRNSSDIPTSGSRTVRFSLGAGLQFAGNGHFYEFVPNVLNWDQAKAQAASKSYFGRQGYLVTVTSQAETDFIRSKLDERGGWIGASDEASADVWRWVTGPEGLEDGGRGRLFWRGTASGTATGYANWNPGEPNASGDIAYFIKKNCTFSGCEFGKWDDVTKTSTSVVDGYVVEYGGLPNDARLTLAGDAVVNVIPVNDNPSDIALAPAAIAELQPISTTVGVFSATDVDGGPTFTYALVAGPGADDNSAFTIVGSQLRATQTFDFETQNSYSIRVRVDDGNGGSFEKIFNVAITNVDVPPTLLPAPPVTGVYGAPLHFVETARGAEPVTVTFGATGLPAGLTIDPATGEVKGIPEAVGVFTATITASNGVAPDASQHVTITVAKAPLVASADDKFIKQTNAVPPLTVSYIGFVSGDGPGDLDVPPVLSTTSDTSNVGLFPITFSTAPVDDKYTITAVPGVLDISLLDIPTLTWPTPADIVYGTPLDITQLNATANVTGTFVYSPSTGAILDAGTGQRLEVTFTPFDTSNFRAVRVTNQISVTRAPLTITANSLTGFLGDPPRVYSARYTGFVAGEGAKDLDVPVQFKDNLPLFPSTGTYVIRPSGAADLHYDITFVDGTLTLALRPQAPIIGNWPPPAASYGDPYHHVVTAFSNAGTVTFTLEAGSVLPPGLSLTADPASGTAVISGTPTATGEFGPLVIKATNAAGSTTSSTAAIQVAKAVLVLRADDRTIKEGTSPEPPDLTGTVSGLKLSDGPGVLTPAPDYSTTATPASPQGNYPIVLANTPTAANYILLPAVKGTLTIVSKDVPVITWPAPADIVYGTPLGASQLNASANTSGIFVYQPQTGSILPAGKGQVLQTAFTPDSDAFTPVLASTPINVTPASLTITADSIVISAGTQIPTLTVTYVGFVNGEGPADLDQGPQLNTPANRNRAGVYPITPSGAKDSNYAITFVPGTLTVVASCSVEGPSTGAPGSTFPYVASGFAPGEDVTIAVDGQAIGTAKADANGVLKAALYLDPGASTGPHTVTNTGAAGSSTCQVTLDPAAQLLADKADRTTVVGRPVGSDSTVPYVVMGCQPNEQVTVRVNGLSTDAAQADGNGNLDGRMFVGDVPDQARFTLEAKCNAVSHAVLLYTEVAAPKQAAPGTGPILEPLPSQPNSHIPFTPCGFTPGEVVDLLIDGKTAGQLTANSSGCLDGQILLGPDTQPGIHTIAAGPAKKQVMVQPTGIARPNPGGKPVVSNVNPAGSPGSKFPVVGTGFNPNGQVLVSVGPTPQQQRPIGTAPVDGNGGVYVVIDPIETDAQTFFVTIKADPTTPTGTPSTTSQITIDPQAPQIHAPDPNTPLPSGVTQAPTQLSTGAFMYLPIIYRTDR